MDNFNLHVSSDGSFWHIFNNMLIYFFTARMYEDLMGKKSALSTYIIGGFCGAILYLITHNLFPLFRDMGNIPMSGRLSSSNGCFRRLGYLHTKF